MSQKDLFDDEEDEMLEKLNDGLLGKISNMSNKETALQFNFINFVPDELDMV